MRMQWAPKTRKKQARLSLSRRNENSGTQISSFRERARERNRKREINVQSFSLLPRLSLSFCHAKGGKEPFVRTVFSVGNDGKMEAIFHPSFLPFGNLSIATDGRDIVVWIGWEWKQTKAYIKVNIICGERNETHCHVPATLTDGCYVICSTYVARVCSTFFPNIPFPVGDMKKK